MFMFNVCVVVLHEACLMCTVMKYQQVATKTAPRPHELHSLKLTGKAPESRPGPKRKVDKVVFQSSISGAMLVSGRLSSSQDTTANLDEN